MVKNKIHWSNYSGECCAKSDIIKGVFTYYVTTFWSHRRNFEQSDLQIRLGHWPQHPCSYKNLYLLQEATTALYGQRLYKSRPYICLRSCGNSSDHCFGQKPILWSLATSNFGSLRLQIWSLWLLECCDFHLQKWIFVSLEYCQKLLFLYRLYSLYHCLKILETLDI